MAEENVDLEGIIRKVRAALATAGGTPNEAEAANAAKMASRLIAKYNLDMKDIYENKDDRERIEDTYTATQLRQSWARYIWHGVAELNFCKYFYLKVPRMPDKHTLIGTKINVLSSQLLAKYLIDTVDRLAVEAPISGHDRSAFRLGCAVRLQRRLLELKAERAKGEIHQSYAGTTLPALADMYSFHKKENDEFYEARHCNEKIKKGTAITTRNHNAFTKGYVAGGTVSLNQQIGKG